MKKGCLIVFVVALCLGVGAVSVTAYRLNKQYGVFEAAAVSHDSLVTGETR